MESQPKNPELGLVLKPLTHDDNDVQSLGIIIRHFVMSPFKSMFFKFFLEKILLKNYKSYNRERSTK